MVLNDIRLAIEADDSLKIALLTKDQNAEFLNKMYPELEDRSLLMYSIMKKAYTVFDILTNIGVDVNAHDEKYITPLQIACARGNTEFTRLLIGLGAEVNVSDLDGWRPLHAACSCNTDECARLLVEAGADIHMEDLEGATALHVACDNDNIKCVEYLLSVGADVDCTDNDGKTPLHILSEDFSSSVKIAGVLIAKGANVDLQDNESRDTPFHKAAWRMNTDLCSLLVKSGANQNIKNASGKTPEDIIDSWNIVSHSTDFEEF